MSKHTPGPWDVWLDGEANQFEVFHVEGRGLGRQLALVVGERGCFRANAYLIAAAPDLLAACEAALDAVGATSAPIANQLRAAITKARGES